LKLIAFAYAGGDGHIYYRMKNKFSKYGIDLLPYMYKGRSSRVNEGCYSSLFEVGLEATEFIKNNIDVEEDYMLLGHSMGSIVAFECYQQLMRIGYKLPKKIFFSGQYPPDKLNKVKYDLENDTKLVYQLSKLGAISTDLLSIPEFKEIFLPIIRNDLRLIEEYTFKISQKIIVPTIILTGSQDEIKGEKVEGWADHSTLKPVFIEIEGNHFFLFKQGITYDFLLNEIFKD
jgi:surfactin synthase thioesterase subunit